MTLKIINITIPEEKTLPDIFSTFSPEENYIMLKIGCECLGEGRKSVLEISQKEIYEKIKNEYVEDIKKLEIDILVEKELSKKTEEKISKIHTIEIENIKKQNEKLENIISDLREQIKSYESENDVLIQKELEKNRDKYDLLLEEKEKRIVRMTEIYEDFLKQNKKSSKSLGDEGENNFYLLSETFRDFIGYKIEKKSHQGHKGDFHLFFNEFNVLVDLKNYTGSVQKKELEKIEHDLLINDTMDFAWLISYESNVSEWNRFPIMYKWIMNDAGLAKCIVIVNNLNANNNPINVLRNIWSITYELHKIINKTNAEDSDVKQLKEREYAVIQKIKTAQKRLTELKRCATTMTQTIKDIENDIIDTISLLSNEVIKTTFDKKSKIQNWWNDKIEFTDISENKLSSSDIWIQFKKDNKENVDDNKIAIEDLKNYIENYIELDNYVKKSKKGTIELIGFTFKKAVEEKLDLDLNIPQDVGNTKKVVKKKSSGSKNIVISEEIDKKIVDQYCNSEDDIQQLSKDIDVAIWQIVSVLVKHKIIAKRNDARGYDIYKETDEYKSKITNK
jgi:hypothetical protein